MTTAPAPFNLMRWIDEHRDEFKPPVMNRQFFPESEDVIIFVSLGPNTRNDYHVNPTEELFYQLEGDIAVRVRPPGEDPRDVLIREGEMWLCPRMLPHRPQRPPGTTGLIVEFPRVVDGRRAEEFLRWYCPECDTLVHEAGFYVEHIDEDLHRIMDAFWNGPEQARTCASCGYVVQRAPEFQFQQ